MTKLSTNSSLTSWSLSLWQIGKKSLEWIQYYVRTPFLGPKWTINPEIIFFFQKNHWYYFHIPLGPFHYARFKKKSFKWIQSYGDASFSWPKWSNCSKNIFFWKIINTTFIYLLTLFIVQNRIPRVNSELCGRLICFKWDDWNEHYLQNKTE